MLFSCSDSFLKPILLFEKPEERVDYLPEDFDSSAILSLFMRVCGYYLVSLSFRLSQENRVRSKKNWESY